MVSVMHPGDTIIQKLQELMPDLTQRGVKDLWIFGSAVRDGASPHDIDLLIEFTDRPTLTGFMDLKFFLEQKLAMPVALHTRASCPERFMKRIQAELHHVA